MCFYSDIYPFAFAVLGSRVEDGSILPGDVALADVRDLRGADLSGYGQVHLFAGIGGLALGALWAGWPVGVRMLTGGFPCQDISSAGKGAGLSGERSGLFWELRRVAGEYPADVCIVENVGALSRRGLGAVAAAMGEVGYVVSDAYRVGAWAVGAPHERERWWIVCWGKRFAQPDAGANRLRAERKRRGARADADESVPQCDGDKAGFNRQDVSVFQRGSRQACAHVGRSGAGLQPDAVCQQSEQSHRHDTQRRSAREAQQTGLGDHLLSDADCGQRRQHQPQWIAQGRAAAGWAGPVTGPWRAGPDGEKQYAGPPVLVYTSGAGRGQRDSAAEPGDARHAAGRPDPTLARGWPVPVLPGFEQRDFEHPRIWNPAQGQHQRGVGDAIHGLPGRVAATLNRLGVMALGNAVVPQVVAAIARGCVSAMNEEAMP